ncbi:hypothetical protein [Citrobacter freundii]|jgi:predicted secreted protein|uniref:hypothetical protein n=1 Tax=Citrobacter freundii TaxID=546 RepID=UPI0022DED729|nr:hypothetical protein [Citrobacter freundii]
MTVHTIKQCRPDQKETEYFWKLFHAAQRNDARWHGSEISIIADELSRTDLDRNQKLFLLRAWQVLVDDKGGFGRFMGAFDTYVYNMQDPDDDCVAWKPELSKLLCDGQLLDVVIDAYQSARQRIAELEAREIKPVKGEVLVTVSGFTGCGKSAIAGEIEIAMKAIGVPVTWSNGDAEKRMTGADWLTAIEMYKPSVRIVEMNVPRAAGIGVKGE